MTQTERNVDEKKRRWLLLILFLISISCLGVAYLFLRYLQKPEPLPEMLPFIEEVAYPPHYLFSIYGLDNPVGVAISGDGKRIFASETGGERLLKAFDTESGEELFAFAPPRTRPGERSPVYMAVDSANRLFVSDRLQHAIFIYDIDGNLIDGILSPDTTLSECITTQAGEFPQGSYLSFNSYEPNIHYQKPGEQEQVLTIPELADWSPLGIFFRPNGEMLLTDVGKDANVVHQFSAHVMTAPSLRSFDPIEIVFGTEGQGNGQFLFPNIAVTDSQGRIYVSDGNNGRISVWSANFEFLFNFGRGTSQGSLNLPRGMDIDDSDRLHIVDAVGQNVKVYDVSGEQPRFLFAFGDLGLDDGQFHYPNDIVVDDTGRLYIADRENNRIQVWSY